MENLTGRTVEIQLLQKALASPQAELIAMYGRRRVGKTHLIQTVFKAEMLLELTGIKGVSLSEQLDNFSATLTDAFHLPLEMATPPSWIRAFRALIKLLEPQLTDTKKVIFLDEFPWFETPKSGFLSAFDHFWNSWAVKQKNLVVVICGSAASWMIQNIVRNKGGLHNRITRRMRLMPFNLQETEQFLRSQHITLNRHQIVELYMVTGGIPQYLKDIDPSESVTQIIDRLCFTKDGWLADEFNSLYNALFDNYDKHLSIVKALADKPSGLTRAELIDICNMSSGGTMTKTLEELLESGFISEHIPFNKTTKFAIFKLSDEYSLFYLKFMKNSKAFGAGTWVKKSTSAAWQSWRGLAFEHIWLKHVPQIKKALNIGAVYTEESAWRYVAKKDAPKNEGKNEKGVQIDLLLDRQDNCINICEVKFSNTIFTVSKDYADNLTHKRLVFQEQTKTKKTIFITLLTSFGVATNEHYLNTVQSNLTMDSLFENV